MTDSSPHHGPVSPSPEIYEHVDKSWLRHPDSLKWTLYPADVIPMWIADMDYLVAKPVLRALQERLARGLGYPQLGGDATLTSALQEKLATQGLTDVPAEGIKYLTGVVPGLYAGVNALSAPGEPVVTMTPIYHPFHLAITDLGRRVASVPLKDTGERYEINWPLLDAASRSSKLLMLCHPHNPTGRVWDAEELRKLRDLAINRDLYVISDELHADLRFTEGPFEAFAADPHVRNRTLTVTGPCKAYNTAGLGIGALVCHDVKLLKRVTAPVAGLMGHPSALSITMWQAALQDGGPWLTETVEFLRGNRDFLTRFLQQRLPWVKFHPVEATYLAWLDLRAHPRAADIQQFLLDEAKVAIHNGPLFAPEPEKSKYQGFVRLNFATSRAILTEALERMAKALGAEV